MKTIKDKIKSNVLPHVPFSGFNRNLRAYWKKEENTKLPSHNYLRNAVASSLFLGISGVSYLFSAIIGTFDFTGWSEGWKENRKKIEIELQKDSYEQFKKYDVDSNKTLDSTEFLKMYRNYSEHRRL